ncbi:MAG: hypothetical protein GDA53_09020 [Rhodobacteraceae bacterium]|nr:hypothetical protein [Paracoccaceae bacterium]
MCSKTILPEFNLRGNFITWPDGCYQFLAVKPKYCPIPEGGPAGWLLGKLGWYTCRLFSLPHRQRRL